MIYWSVLGGDALQSIGPSTSWGENGENFSTLIRPSDATDRIGEQHGDWHHGCGTGRCHGATTRTASLLWAATTFPFLPFLYAQRVELFKVNVNLTVGMIVDPPQVSAVSR